MSLDSDAVLNIAKLARISIAEDDIPAMADQLSKILNFVEQMNAVDTNGVEPMAHPLDLTQRLRDDEVTESDQREQFQSIAPQVEAGLYLVPKVIE